MLRSHSFLRVLLAVTTLAFVAGLAMAADEAEKPKALDGKELFKTSCKVCHGAKAAAGEYTPMTLIQEQWDEFFAGAYADTHAKVATPEAADAAPAAAPETAAPAATGFDALKGLGTAQAPAKLR